DKAFNEWHILAISQAICLYRERQKIDGPLFLGMDTHALSELALASALEVWRPTEWKSCSQRAMNTPRPRPFPTRFSRTTAGAKRDSPTASSSRRHTIRLTTVGSNTIPQMEDRRNPSSLTGSRPRQTSFSRTAFWV